MDTFDLLADLSRKDLPIANAVSLYGFENIEAAKNAGYAKELGGNLCLTYRGREIAAPLCTIGVEK